MKQIIRRFGIFTFVGAIGTAAHYLVLIVGTRYGGMDPVFGSLSGAVVGAMINYALNYRFTFQSTRRHREAAPRFMTIAFAGIVLNTLTMAFCVRTLGLHYLGAQVIATGFVLVTGFYLNRIWTFAKD